MLMTERIDRVCSMSFKMMTVLMTKVEAKYMSVEMFCVCLVTIMTVCRFGLLESSGFRIGLRPTGFVIVSTSFVDEFVELRVGDANSGSIRIKCVVLRRIYDGLRGVIMGLSTS